MAACTADLEMLEHARLGLRADQQRQQERKAALKVWSSHPVERLRLR